MSISLHSIDAMHAGSETVRDQLPDFSEKVDALLAFRDEQSLSPEQFAEVVDAMLDTALRHYSSLAPALVATRFRSDLESRAAA